MLDRGPIGSLPGPAASDHCPSAPDPTRGHPAKLPRTPPGRFAPTLVRNAGSPEQRRDPPGSPPDRLQIDRRPRRPRRLSRADRATASHSALYSALERVRDVDVRRARALSAPTVALRASARGGTDRSAASASAFSWRDLRDLVVAAARRARSAPRAPRRELGPGAVGVRVVDLVGDVVDADRGRAAAGPTGRR